MKARRAGIAKAVLTGVLVGDQYNTIPVHIVLNCDVSKPWGGRGKKEREEGREREREREMERLEDLPFRSQEQKGGECFEAIRSWGREAKARTGCMA